MAQDITKVIDHVNKAFNDRHHGDSFWIDELCDTHPADTGHALEWWRDCMAPELARVFGQCDQTVQDPITITLSWEDMAIVLHWIQYGADYHNAKMHEWLANCADKAMAGGKAREHELTAANAARLAKIIEAAMIPNPAVFE